MKKKIFLTTLLVLLLVVFQGRCITEKSSVCASTTVQQDYAETPATEASVMLPANAKVYMRYNFFADEKYKIYRAGNSYFLCYGKKILTVTDLGEDLKPAYFDKCSLWPFAYSTSNNLYIIQANFTKPKLEFIKVATNCKSIGSASNYDIHLPIYQKLDTKKKFLVMPSSLKSYKNYASIDMIEQQTGKYSSKYKSKKLTKKNIKVALNCWGDSLRWDADYYYKNSNERFWIYSDSPLFKSDCGIKNNYLNFIIDEVDSATFSYWATDSLSLENLSFHLKLLQNYMNEWEESHDITIFRWFLNNPDWFKIFKEDSKSGLENWLKYNKTYADQLIKNK